MNLTKLWQTVCICCFCLALHSCDSSDPYEDAPQTVRLLDIEASINFDLSARKDWIFDVRTKPYTFQIDGNTLLAVPQDLSKPYTFEITANKRTGEAIMTFMSKNYFKPGQSSALPADIEDQSTPEKFLDCDVLRGHYIGDAMENISVTFFHENALLMFNTVDLPEDAEVFIYELYNKQTITPLRDAEDRTSYKALVFPNNLLKTVYVIVRTNGKEYAETLVPLYKTRANISYPQGIGHSAIITFNVLIDENDKLLINDLKEKSFSKEWPDIF